MKIIYLFASAIMKLITLVIILYIVNINSNPSLFFNYGTLVLTIIWAFYPYYEYFKNELNKKNKKENNS